jgi:hypothetical protein
MNCEKGITFLNDEGNFVRQVSIGAFSHWLTSMDTGLSITLNNPEPGIVIRISAA